jgi:hypothetical protein
VRRNLSNLSYELDRLGDFGVREGDSGDVHAGGDEGLEDFRAARSGTDGRDNACSASLSARTPGMSSDVLEKRDRNEAWPRLRDRSRVSGRFHCISMPDAVTDWESCVLPAGVNLRPT